MYYKYAFEVNSVVEILGSFEESDDTMEIMVRSRGLD